MTRPPCPPEEAEQRTVAAYLDARGDLLWTHVPNESLRSPRQGRRLQLAGMKRGVPDVLVFKGFKFEWSIGGVKPVVCEYHGLAIELKRERGGTITPEQRQWQFRLGDNAWHAVVCRGADEAIKLIEQCYGPQGGRR